jgi:CRP-like cAMP-binding protein/formate hydrogenlyase subunit 6/NADH:ubiquinone oxidoreductase subunit I
VRACDEVKENVVIGRTGKGYAAHIGFDLNDPMGQSTCVSCGECAASCPTGALTFRGFVRPEPWQGAEAPEPVSAKVLKTLPLFSGVSEKFLKWNEGAAVRRTVKAGDVLCREGDFGSTAFLILKGRYDVSLRTPVSDTRKDKAPGLLGVLGKAVTRLAGTRTTGGPAARVIPVDGGPPLSLTGRPVAVVTPQDVILGEMACMGNYPRAATVTALEDGEVIEILRNVVYMLQRNRASREMLDRAYRDRALGSHLFNVGLFAELDEAQRKECVAFLKEKVELVRVDPGQVIFLQGEPADNFFLVRQGFVKVAQKFYTQERVLNYLGPGSHFGEIGLLSAMSDLIARQVPTGLKPGVRTATCSALDHVELVRVRGDHFRELLNAFPALREQVTAVALRVLEQNARARADTERPLGDFLQQGLFGAQSLLVLDLNKCTRCDECTKACADTHEGVTRLIREGLRFENYLVATSCRSCLDPYCMVGCPVGSIRREGSLEIRIESWCIGCGLCAENCPYGNINMVETKVKKDDPTHPGKKVMAQERKATTCDLCRDIAPGGTDPSCVYACPHDAAFRMSGPQLLAAVDKSGE